MAKFGLGPHQEHDGGTNEVQTVTITGGPTGGTFTLTYAGQTTAATAYNASAATVQTNLIALSNIDDVSVTRSGAGSAGDPYIWTVTFEGTLAATDVAEMTGDGASLTGGTTPAVVNDTTTDGVARAAESFLVQNSDRIAVMLMPTSDVVGNVTLSMSIDGGTTYATVHTETMAASTNVLVHIIDMPATHLKIDTTALTAGMCDAQIAVATQS